MKWFARLIKILTLLTLAGIIVLGAVFAYFYHETELDADKLIHYAPNISSEILDRHGKRLAFIFKGRHRLYARYDEIPPHLIEALVAIEDTKFFEHNGVNPDAILRAIVRDIRARRFVEGGSTITQQLIKITLLSSEKKLKRKIREAILALKIEQRLTKEQILERYLNEIPYGNNYFGVKTAAQGYFHKALKDLTLKESVLLVGLPNAPSYYNPLRHYKRALNRANAILHRMKTLGWITEEEYLKASKETPKVYRTSLTQNIAPYVIDELLRRFKNRFGDIRTGGYTIYTTIDAKLQANGRKALRYGFDTACRRYGEDPDTTDLNGGLIAVENTTGDILALVGGIDYSKSAFNRITMTRRQPGSAFKPFVYQTALDMGYNPATKLTDLARTFRYTQNGRQKIWAPRNYERDYKGFITLRDALVHSRNLATVNLVYDIGIEPIRKRLALLDVPDIPEDLSIALGNLGLSPLKMAQIYTVFSNQGHMIEPRLVSKIVSKEGSVIYETFPKEIADFTRPEQAYLMTDMLRDVIRRGTGRKARVEGIELAGKTGTTNDGIDAWFCGYSPATTTVVWYGRDTHRPIGKHATGGSIAAPAFAAFYRGLLTLYPDTPKDFIRPEGVMEGLIDGRTELYTAISPLPRTDGSLPSYAPDNYARKTRKSTRAEANEEPEEIEEIRLDEDNDVTTTEETTEEKTPEESGTIEDPIHLKPKPPRNITEENEALF
jgi:penicillin-binding protein 1A